MNALDEKIINKELNYVYQKHIEKYGINNILGVFVTGLANYGFAKTKDDLSYTVLYLPTFEELCLTHPKEIIHYNYRFLDIRLLYESAHSDSYDILELLFCDYYIITKKYQKLFNEIFIQERETIGHYCPKVRAERARNQALDAIRKDNLFEAVRLRISLENYLKGKSCYDYYHTYDSFQLFYLENLEQTLKDGKKDVIEELRDDLQQLVSQADTTINESVDKKIKKGIVRLMSIALEGKIELNDFRKQLTDNEQKAFSALIKNLNGHMSGTVSISQLSKETNLSRPVFKNLLNKIESNGVAQIENHGVKGTEIVFVIPIEEEI